MSECNQYMGKVVGLVFVSKYMMKRYGPVAAVQRVLARNQRRLLKGGTNVGRHEVIRYRP